MTMISPELYLEKVWGLSYLELISERDKLIGFILKFEKAETTGVDIDSDPSWRLDHSSSVVMYQMYLQYLSVLCHFMYEKYNWEYVWGWRTLRQDAEDKRNG